MALTTPNAALPYPELTDIPNAQTAFQNLATQLDSRVVQRFASSAARDSAIPSPAEGQLCYRTDINGLQEYNGSWRPANVINCLSSGRPSGPETGRIIFETDTLRAMVYSGSAWVSLSPYRRTQTLGSSAASVTFSSIPATIKQLTVRYRMRGDAVAPYQDLRLRIGGDTGGNYRHQITFVQNTTYGATVQTGQTSGHVGYIPCASAGSGIFGDGEIILSGWNEPTADNLPWKCSGGFADPTAGQNLLMPCGVGHYYGTSAYTSLTLLLASGNVLTGSQVMIEGYE